MINRVTTKLSVQAKLFYQRKIQRNELVVSSIKRILDLRFLFKDFYPSSALYQYYLPLLKIIYTLLKTFFLKKSVYKFVINHLSCFYYNSNRATNRRSDSTSPVKIAPQGV